MSIPGVSRAAHGVFLWLAGLSFAVKLAALIVLVFLLIPWWLRYAGWVSGEFLPSAP